MTWLAKLAASAPRPWSPLWARRSAGTAACVAPTA